MSCLYCAPLFCKPQHYSKKSYLRVELYAYIPAVAYIKQQYYHYYQQLQYIEQCYISYAQNALFLRNRILSIHHQVNHNKHNSSPFAFFPRGLLYLASYKKRQLFCVCCAACDVLVLFVDILVFVLDRELDFVRTVLSLLSSYNKLLFFYQQLFCWRWRREMLYKS